MKGKFSAGWDLNNDGKLVVQHVDTVVIVNGASGEIGVARDGEIKKDDKASFDKSSKTLASCYKPLDAYSQAQCAENAATLYQEISKFIEEFPITTRLAGQPDFNLVLTKSGINQGSLSAWKDMNLNGKYDIGEPYISTNSKSGVGVYLEVGKPLKPSKSSPQLKEQIEAVAACLNQEGFVSAAACTSQLGELQNSLNARLNNALATQAPTHAK